VLPPLRRRRAAAAAGRLRVRDNRRVNGRVSWLAGVSALALGLFGLFGGSASAFGPVGVDPASNFPAGPLPSACASTPTALTCINAAVYYLDQARANLGQPAYALPADFATLPVDQEAFILTNLDRVHYGLPAVPDLTVGLDADAAAGVSDGTDPNVMNPAAPFSVGSANWAGDFDNMPLAYEAWMYADGIGSGNLDCTASNKAGCWGHRHDILWNFVDGNLPTPVLGMGAATGTGPDTPGESPGYAMVIGANYTSTAPSDISYTWVDAMNDGAGTNVYNPGLPAVPLVGVKVTVAGSGSVSDSNDASCHRKCSLREVRDFTARFVAHPSRHEVFAGWRGACHGTGVCRIKLRGPGTVLSAVFAAHHQ
jgi:hypothetical protein